MATGLQVEQLDATISQEKPKRNRQQALKGLQELGAALGSLKSTKDLLDEVATAGHPYEPIKDDWTSNLQSVVNGGFTYSTKTALAALNQLLADLGDQSGTPALRLAVGGTIRTDADQDA